MAGIMEADMTGKNQKPVEYAGVLYPSTTALAAAYGLRRDTLNLRLKKHIPLDLPRYAKKTANYRSIDYRGVTYKSLGALAKAFGLKKQTCGMRLLRHIPLDRPLRKGALKPCEYQGRRYESLKDFARDNDIRYEDAHICIDACGRWLDEKE